jgi:hypothetical protein
MLYILGCVNCFDHFSNGKDNFTMPKYMAITDFLTSLHKSLYNKVKIVITYSWV